MAIAQAPIDWQEPIVDADGVPTAAFQRLWEALNNLAGLTSGGGSGGGGSGGVAAAIIFRKG